MDAIMKAAGLIDGPFFIGILLRMVAEDGGVDWMIKARSICGAALEESRMRLQVDMQTIDHGILEAGGLVGLFGQYLRSLVIDDDCIRHRRLEIVQVVEVVGEYCLKSRYMCFAATRLIPTLEEPTHANANRVQAAGKLQHANNGFIIQHR